MIAVIAKYLCGACLLTFYARVGDCCAGGGVDSLVKSVNDVINKNNTGEPFDVTSIFTIINNVLRAIPPDFEKYIGAADDVVVKIINENLQQYLGEIEATKYESASSGAVIRCPSDLDCDFSRQCRWSNSRQDILNYYLTTGTPDAEAFRLYTGSTQLPTDPFLLTAANAGDYNCWFISDTVPPQDTAGQLTFRFWLTPLIELQACVRRPSKRDFEFCSKTYVAEDAPYAQVEIPPMKFQFEIVIATDNFKTDPGGVVFIDDIAYRSDLCDEPEPKRLPDQDDNGTGDQEEIQLNEEDYFEVCQAVACNFDQGSRCAYNTFSPLGDRPWRPSRESVGNPATGILKDVDGSTRFRTWYMLATGARFGDKELFVAESGSFELQKPVTVKMYKHLMTNHGRIRVCINSVTNCPHTYILNLSEQGWQQTEFQLDPADLSRTGVDNRRPIKLLIIADGLTRYSYAGFARVQIYDADGRRKIC